MKHFNFVLTLLLCCVQFVSAQTMNTDLASGQRLAYAMAKKLAGADKTYKYYVSKTTVKKDGSDRWLVFIDKMPRAGWEHPCTYVYAKPGDCSVENCIAVDSVCPPSDVRLVPVLKSNDDSDDLEDIKVEKGAANEYAQHTYAVILSGGKDINSNSSRYWNDCSFIYQTLTRKYNVPKANVKVLMSDGKDPADDIHNESGSLYFSSPLDLDGDGSADIEYSATKSNLKKVFDEFSSALGDEDQLFVYVIDHGGYDKQKKSSYICLWNGERLYPDELNGYIGNCEAGYISFVMGQCNSGGFVKPLHARNRIIMTACGDGEKDFSYGCEELPFDEYVYRWTCGINGRDAYGNTLPDFFYKDKKTYVPYYKTLKSAHAYACRTDCYASGNAVVSETPVISIFENSTADDLTFDYVPDVCELYITSGEEPTTPREIIFFPEDYSGDSSSQFTPSFLFRAVYWNSADIWLRRQDDGLTSRTHQSGCLGENEKTIYVYAKIRNRGVKTYDTCSKQLRMWWARSAMKIDMKTWKGMKTIASNGVYGNNIGFVPIMDTLEPGDSTIVSMDYTFGNGYLALARQKDFNACLLAFIVDEKDLSDDSGIETDDKTLCAKVWSTRRMAQKNLTSAIENTTPPSVIIPNLDTVAQCELRTTVSSADSSLFKQMNVYLNVSNGSVSSWTPKKKGELSPKAFNPAVMSNKVMLADSCRICNIQLTGKKVCSLTLTAEEVASEDILKDRDYTLNVELYDPVLETSLGGQSFIVRQKARKRIDFDVSSRLDGMGNYDLRMSSPSEELTCVWKDRNGNAVASGPECLVPANGESIVYTVEARSTTDGAICFRSITLQRIPKIENIRTVSDKELCVEFSSPAGKNTSLRLASASSGLALKDCPVAEGARNAVVPLAGIQDKLATVILVESGKQTESVKVVK